MQSLATVVEAEGPGVGIPARSERQAMDWSLVLASQGIEAIIDHQPVSGSWILWVTGPEHSRALGAIRQYRLENRRWNWRQDLVWPEVTFHWGVLFWVTIMAVVFWLNEATGDALVTAGAMNNLVPATGQWGRLVTAVSLHADVGHLAVNMATGIVLLGLAMGRFGPGVAVFTALAGGVGGNAAGLLIRGQPYLGLGSSGMVMAALGLLTAQSVSLLRRPPRPWRPVAACVFGGLLLFVLLGVNPESDVLAHAAGFAVGLAAGIVLALASPAGPVRAGVDRIFAVLAGIVAAAAWAWALRG